MLHSLHSSPWVYMYNIYNAYLQPENNGGRIVFVLEVGNLRRSEWKLEHELNQCLHLV